MKRGVHRLNPVQIARCIKRRHLKAVVAAELALRPKVVAGEILKQVVINKKELQVQADSIVIVSFQIEEDIQINFD